MRLEEGAAKALVTADGTTRRGKVVPMKETADAAVAAVPGVETVVVVDRLGHRRADAAGARPHARRVLRARRRRAASRRRRSTPSTRCSSRTRAAPPASPRAWCTCTAGFVVKIAEEVGFQADCRSSSPAATATTSCSGSPTSAGSWGRGRSSGRSRGAPRCSATTARPTTPVPTGSGRWSSGTASRSSASRPRWCARSWRRATSRSHAHDLSSLRVLGSTGEPWNEGPWWWYFRHGRRRAVPGHQRERRHRGRVLPRAARRRADRAVLARRPGARLRGRRRRRRLQPGARRGRRARSAAGRGPR